MANKKEQTDYIVLVSTGEYLGKEPGAWLELGTVQASSQASAKRQALAQYKPEGGTVVAVPARSWEPEDLKPKLSFA
jgi:hypothetical protein